MTSFSFLFFVVVVVVVVLYESGGGLFSHCTLVTQGSFTKATKFRPYVAELVFRY